MPSSTSPATAPFRFAQKHRLDKATGCWLWSASTNGNGYGNFHDGERHVGAHHYSYRLHRGPIPQGLYVCHQCDVPSCVNPDHLFLDTPAGNQQDAVKKGRARAGRPEWRHSPELKLKVQKDPRSYHVIAEAYGLSFGTVKSLKSAEGLGHRARRIGVARDEIERLRAVLQQIAVMTDGQEMAKIAAQALSTSNAPSLPKSPLGAEAIPFIPGFETIGQARAAGRKFFAKANGMNGCEGRDFHIVQNEHGRWHFEEGKAPKIAPPDPA